MIKANLTTSHTPFPSFVHSSETYSRTRGTGRPSKFAFPSLKKICSAPIGLIVETTALPDVMASQHSSRTLACRAPLSLEDLIGRKDPSLGKSHLISRGFHHQECRGIRTVPPVDSLDHDKERTCRLIIKTLMISCYLPLPEYLHLHPIYIRVFHEISLTKWAHLHHLL